MKKILVGDAIDKLKEIPDQSVNCIVTSPPYYGLRDYGTGEWIGGDPNCPHRRVSKQSEHTITGHAQDELKGNVGDAIYKTVCPLCGAIRVDRQIGLEETPEEYIERLVNIFRECKRVLRDDGTLWINIGDSYAGSGKGPSQSLNRDYSNMDKIWKGGNIPQGTKSKDLIGIPWMLAFALRSDGWYLRQDIIWHKPNPMPESVKDRCTKSHEYIFLLSKKPKYYFDYEAIQEDADPKNKKRYNSVFNKGKVQEHFRPDGATNTMGMKKYTGKRNKRDVWDGNSKYIDCEQEASVRQGMSRNRGQNIVLLRKNLPEQAEFVAFMRTRTSVNTIDECTDIKRSTIEHWFRTDNSGFCFPSIEDWIEIRDYVNDHSDEYQKIDEMMMDVSVETDDIDKNFDGKRNKRDVWNVTTKGVKEAHFATFPEALIEPCILAGCPVGGVVLDPFCGSGTAGIVSVRNERDFIGIELNPEYAEMSIRRIEKEEQQGIQMMMPV